MRVGNGKNGSIFSYIIINRILERICMPYVAEGEMVMELHEHSESKEQRRKRLWTLRIARWAQVKKRGPSRLSFKRFWRQSPYRDRLWRYRRIIKVMDGDKAGRESSAKLERRWPSWEDRCPPLQADDLGKMAKAGYDIRAFLLEGRLVCL